MKRSIAWLGSLFLSLCVVACGLHTAGGSVGTDNPAVAVAVGPQEPQGILSIEIRLAEQNPIQQPEPIASAVLEAGGSHVFEGLPDGGRIYSVSLFAGDELIDLRTFILRKDTALVLGQAESNYGGCGNCTQDSVSYDIPRADSPTSGSDSLLVGAKTPVYVYVPGTRLSWPYDSSAPLAHPPLPSGNWTLIYTDSEGSSISYTTLIVP